MQFEDSMIFAGECYFADGDRILVPRLALEPGSRIQFDLHAQWDDTGIWQRESQALWDTSSASYISPKGPTYNPITGEEGDICMIKFTVAKVSEGFLHIEGTWFEDRESYPFEGDLEPQSTT